MATLVVGIAIMMCVVIHGMFSWMIIVESRNHRLINKDKE